MIAFPENAYATCVNYIQSQTIAAAYEGDSTPTVYTMDTCSGDDVSYQIPIATTITFDGIQYDQVYATTNSVITFGNADNTYWDYPSTPSISLYSMDWYAGYGAATDGLDISYSEGGFQINLQVIPYGQWNAEASNINILVAITNTGGISVAYSYQGPQYSNLRTGVRLHSGQIVSLEEWGATQVQPGDSMPTLQPDPVSETTEPTTEELVQSVQLSNEINNINSLIASINGEPAPTPTPEPTVSPEPEPTTDPDVVVPPEIIDPNDPRFPDGQTQPDPTNPSQDSDTTPQPTPSPEPSVEPSSQPEGTDQDPVVQPDKSDLLKPDSQPSNNNSISEEELKKLNILISANDAKILAQLFGTNPSVKQAVEEFTERAGQNINAPMPYTIADAITEVQTEKFLENPIGALTNIELDKVLNPSEWGKDMTDDQREKVQEVVIPVILASNIIAASMTRRNK